jgi:hypothetical protein
LSATSSRGGGQVEAGLRFARVGDGGGADLEIALGRGQLLGDTALLKRLGAQRVLRGQHVEIGLRHAHDQVLLGGFEVGLGHVQRPPGLLQRGAVAAVEQRVPALHADRGIAVADAGTGDGVDLGGGGRPGERWHWAGAGRRPAPP